MGTLSLNLLEKELCAKVAHGEPYTAPTDSEHGIQAELIRHIVLGLPIFAEEEENPEAPKCITVEDPKGRKCPTTPVGIHLIGGKIKGRVTLNSASRKRGGPLLPLHFERVTFDGGFSGADGYFSHLSFVECTFCDAYEDRKVLPSIDLSNARIESDLDLHKSRPDGLELPAQPPGWTGEPTWREENVPAGANHHWIKLTGARVAGMIDLCESYLRAPENAELAAARPEALNMSLIEAAGDFQFGRGSCATGAIWAKNAHFRGDFWLHGARLDGRGGQSLMLQSAAIDGILVIDSRYDDESCTEPFRRFSAHGEINLHGLRLGGKLFIKNATVTPSRDARPSTALRPEREGGRGGDEPAFLALCLSGARIPELMITGGAEGPSKMLGLIQLNGLRVGGSIQMNHLRLGREGRCAKSSIVSARGLRAGNVEMTDLKPVADGAKGQQPRALSLDLRDAVLGELQLVDSELNGVFTAPSLTVRGDMVLGLSAVKEVDLCALTVEGSLDLSALKISSAEPTGARLVLKGAQIGRALRLSADHGGTAFEVTPGRDAAPMARPNVDLSDVSCGMLDDQGGRLWGAGLVMRMDRLVYGSATWEPPYGGSSPKPIEQLKCWFNGKLAEWLCPERLTPRKLAAKLRRGDFWSPWQVRRNWIYQQFPKARARLAPSRHRIRDWEYRPQPFEQAAKAARAEGREEIAINFEMLKWRIEWDLFNRTSRWWLAGIGIIFACFWLLQQSRWEPVVPVGVVLAVMVAVAWCWALEKLPIGPFGWPIFPNALLWLLALIAFFAGDWDREPLVFLAAALIFGAIRLLSWLSNFCMRWMFGYLRRPVRAIGTFIAAFVVGWLGVHAANSNGMMVIEATPVAVAAAESEAEELGDSSDLTMVSPDVRGEQGFIRNVPCAKTISEPLYALDVLIPLLDLRQESRCEVGHAHNVAKAPIPRAKPGAGSLSPLDRGFAAVDLAGRQLRALFHEDRSWAVLKALYAIAGWFIVSLSILTFANIHRGPGTSR